LLGRSVAFHPDVMIYGMLKSAVANIDSPSSSSTFFNINFPAPVCYDGVTLLSANGHPVGPQGNTTLVANCNNGGSGPFWFLIDASRPVRPVMFQIRKPFEAVHMSMPTDEYVFNNRQYRFGVDGRDAAAPGFWQFIYASNQDLNNPSNYEAARSAMRAIKGDDGLPMFVWDDSAEERYLVVPTTLEGPARRLLHNEFGPGGGDFDASTPSTNIWKNDAKLIVTPLLN
jgi:phage major head subunit gpT-like protein